MPRFAGCEELEGTIAEKTSCADKKMMEFVYKNVKFSSTYEALNCGTILIAFVVEKDGSISNIQILKSCEVDTFNQMLLDIFNSFPKFEPGKHKGVPVRVQYRLPMRFCFR